MQPLTESMYYVLMALYEKDTFGTEIVEYIEKITNNRIKMGPGTLYTIINKFESEGLIKEIAVEGRKRTYTITNAGKVLFTGEVNRLEELLSHGERVLKGDSHE